MLWQKHFSVTKYRTQTMGKHNWIFTRGEILWNKLWGNNTFFVFRNEIQRITFKECNCVLFLRKHTTAYTRNKYNCIYRNDKIWRSIFGEKTMAFFLNKMLWATRGEIPLCFFHAQKKRNRPRKNTIVFFGANII